MWFGDDFKFRTKMTTELSLRLRSFILMISPGGHFHWKLYHIRVNRPQKSTLNEDSRVDQKSWANFLILNEDNCRDFMISYTLNQDYFFFRFHTPKRGLDTKSGYCPYEL